ncbi:MAG: proteasome assembly chaperone family protein, partial [Nitrososphaeraceae archaeon]
MFANDTKIIETKQSEKSEYRNDASTTTDGRTSIRYVHDFDKHDRIKSNNAVLVAGFSGPGLVGSIGANYIIEKLGMHQIACVDSEFIVPGVIYIGGKLRHPFRLYINEQADIYVLECEAPILIQGIHSVLSTATKWCVDNNIRKVIVLEGYPVRGIPLPNRQPIVLSSDNSKEQSEMPVNAGPHEIESTNNSNDQKRRIRKRQFENAFIGGISGGLLSACLSNEISCAALLIPTTIGMPDPEG